VKQEAAMRVKAIREKVYQEAGLHLSSAGYEAGYG
jgi:hypothetical protein